MVTTVSVVMTTYQTGEALKFAVDSVLGQKNLAELVIVDNGNPEEMLGWLRETETAQKKVKLVTGQGNVGFGVACNLGAKEANGDILLFLNPDSIVPENALKAFAIALDKNEEAWMVGGRLRNPDASEQRGSRRNLLTPHTALAETLRLDIALSWDRLNLHEEKLPEEITEVPAISGACMAIRRERFEELEGFDEAYFLHVEDLDLCRRIQDAGGKILFVPNVDILHLQGSSNASFFFVEWQKAQGFITYFDKFENKVMWLFMAVLALINFGVKSAWMLLKRIMPENKDRIRSERRLMWLHRHLREDHKDNAIHKDKTYLVTGSTSQIGVCTIGHLLAAGAKVVAVEHHTKLYFEHPNLSWVRGNLEKGKLELGEHKPEALIHCAPMWMLKPALAEMFNARIKRVIAFSSTSVFVKIYSANAAERDTVKALEEAELHLAERCQKAGASFTILRPTMIYGLGLDENVTQISDFARRYHFFPLYPPADGRRMPVHADDLAQMAIKVISNTKTHNKSYNIGGGEVVGYRAMVERIFLALGQRPRTVKLKYLPMILDFIGKWFFSSKINGEMARRMNEDMVFVEAETRRDFAFKPRGFLEGGKSDLGQF
ncbi:MAG: glycosyltransferase [Rickettsiales bacterium]|nr:glycosyltransferase [Rickettsiales bacterium]